MKYITITITTPNKKITNKIIKVLLSQNLVSCVNIISNIESVYWWKNKINKKKEYLLICKSIKSNFEKIVKKIKENHPYEVPEIVCYDMLDGEQNYLKWITCYTKNATNK